MKIVSIAGNSVLCEKVKAYCKEKWGKVYECFAECADKSVTAELLPQTWVALEFEDEITGFYQLSEHDLITRKDEFTPFITSLYVDPIMRGGFGMGEMLLDHARYEAARLGFDKLYLTTDHIGYYEKYGFREIGLDMYDWGRPTKLYEADTYGDVRFEIYDKACPKTNRLHIELAKYRGWDIGDNPADLLRSMKYCYFPESYAGQWFTIVAFNGNDIAGTVNFARNIDDQLNWYIGDLSVKRDLRCRKIALRMVSRGLDIIRLRSNGVEFVYAYIEKDNIASASLFKKLGFYDSGEIRPFANLVHSDSDTTYILDMKP
ncbi:MAG: GNAT family N-acetyltransferase [Oscillospiraceae bacterium]|nr:GNAT family N-acetyltransferase [Oscillospiraceae bacterium]